MHQAGRVWGQMLVADPELPSLCNWGWKKTETGGWDAQWTLLPAAVVACRELLHWQCKKGCRNNASVASLHSDVLHSVYVMVSVLKINILSHK